MRKHLLKKFSFYLENDEIYKLEDLAKNSKTNPSAVIAGIVKLYLKGKIGRSYNITEAERNRALELRSQGFTHKDIGETLGRSKDAIQRALNKNNKNEQ